MNSSESMSVAEAPANYKLTIDNDALVRLGYKRTEVGAIPDDWEIPAFKEICTLVNGRGFKPHEWKAEGLPIIRIQNLNGSDDFNYYAGHYNPKIFIQHGQLLFAWSGSRGTSFGPHVWKGGDALLNYHTWKLIVNDAKVDPRYFFHTLKALTKSIEDKAHGASALVHTQKGEMEGYLVSLPPTLKEQHAIAEALSDVDTLIASLETLIAKKRDIKTAAMQQLLTGKKRLPGFGEGKGDKQTELGKIPEDWSLVALEKISAFITKGSTPTTYGFSWQQDGVLFLRSECVSEIGLDLSQSMFISRQAHEVLKRSGVCGGDILITITGNVGRIIFLADGFFEGNINQHIARIRIKEKSVAPAFVYHYLMRPEVRRYYNSVVTGQAYPQISLKQVRETIIPFPLLEEQIAITQILTEMDNELAALESRLQKTQSLKQGMMQELLTGRTRLL